jgi:putative CocE/NonD family hydrolase
LRLALKKRFRIAHGASPVLVYRTPYGKKNAREECKTPESAVNRGYAAVIQDVRGRYRQDGQFRPYESEGRHGFNTIEWAAGQPWSSGAIGTFGPSYPGAVQWLAAVQTPPHLKAMVPAITRQSTIAVYADAAHASQVILPVGASEITAQ